MAAEQDLYGDADMPASSQDNGQPKEQEEKPEAKTALINSDICPGMKPGEEMVVKIERVLDSGEYEVSYAPEPEKKGDKAEGEGAQEMAAPASESGGKGGGMASLYE